MLFLLADLEPVFDEDNAIIFEESLKAWAHAQKICILLVRAKFHYVFDERTVVPASVEDNDLTSRRQFFDVALRVQLRLFTLGGGGQSNVAKDARTHAFQDSVNYAAFPRRISSFKDNHQFGAARFDPLLHLDQLRLKLTQFSFVILLCELGRLIRWGVSL